MNLKLNDPSEWRITEIFNRINDIKKEMVYLIEIDQANNLPSRMYDSANDIFMYFAKQVEPNFEIDDSTKSIYRDLLDWLLNNPCGKYDPLKGFMFVGHVGSGKTTIMKIIKEAGRAMRFPLEESRELSFRITSMTEIIAYYQNYGLQRMLNEYAIRECQAIDDVGTEVGESLNMGNRTNPFANIVEFKYNHRNNQRHMLHLTTNLDSQQMIEKYGSRTLDRLKEMVNIVKIEGKSHRKYNNTSSDFPLDKFKGMASGEL